MCYLQNNIILKLLLFPRYVIVKIRNFFDVVSFEDSGRCPPYIKNAWARWLGLIRKFLIRKFLVFAWYFLRGSRYCTWTGAPKNVFSSDYRSINLEGETRNPRLEALKWFLKRNYKSHLDEFEKFNVWTKCNLNCNTISKWVKVYTRKHKKNQNFTELRKTLWIIAYNS